jgi:hypothetical protein
MAKHVDDDSDEFDEPGQKAACPQCDNCKQHREGEHYAFWGGVLSNKTERDSVLMVVKTVTTTYSELNKVEVYLCKKCVSGSMFWNSLYLIVCSLFALAIGVAVLLITKNNTLTWIAAIWTGVMGLGLCGGVYSLFSFDMTSEDTQEVIAKYKNRLLRSLGTMKKQTFFTEAQYESMTRDKTRKEKPIKHKTAQELIAAGGDVDDDDDDADEEYSAAVKPKKTKGKQALADALLNYTRCPNCRKHTPIQPKVCKHCATKLP